MGSREPDSYKHSGASRHPAASSSSFLSSALPFFPVTPGPRIATSSSSHVTTVVVSEANPDLSKPDESSTEHPHSPHLCSPSEPSAKRPRLLEACHLSSLFVDGNANDPLESLPPPTRKMGKQPYRPLDHDRLGSKGQIRTVDFLRLIEQSLVSLGYPEVSALLEEQSGVSLESHPVSQLREAILGGEWEEGLRIVASFNLPADSFHSARFLLLEQQYLELLERGDTISALTLLRTHLAPFSVTNPTPRTLSFSNFGDLGSGGSAYGSTPPSCESTPSASALKAQATEISRRLAGLLLCSGADELRSRAAWAGANTTSRLAVLQGVQACLPPDVMVPARRLEGLVEQAVQAHADRCHYHNMAGNSLSLFVDHECGKRMIPTVTTQVLEQHADEVWFLQFSNDGTRLASASKDCTAAIWEITSESSSRLLHVLRGHSKPLSFVGWSPDDQKLLTTGNDNVIILWDAVTGACLHKYSKHTQPVSACAWFPCGQKFVSGGQDKQLFVWDVDGNELPSWHGVGKQTWPHSEMPRINDMAMSRDGSHLVAICNDKDIMVQRLPAGDAFTVRESQSITSLCLSHDGKWVLVNLNNGLIHLWSIDDICERRAVDKPTHKYSGQVQKRFVIRSCFGGRDQRFIVSGSEDAQVYMWHSRTGEMMEALQGHTGTVNAVAWPQARPHMLASASDDRTIRIWAPRAVAPAHGGCEGGDEEMRVQGGGVSEGAGIRSEGRSTNADGVADMWIGAE